MTIQAAMMPDGRRLHLQHGPIDLIVEAWGRPEEIWRAYEQARTAFAAILPNLASELPLLRSALPLSTGRPRAKGGIANNMIDACWPHRASFMTPMAAVAGAVADHLLCEMTRGRVIGKAYVNNGGDIALLLQGGERFDCGLVTDLLSPKLAGIIHITSAMAIGGIATSGAPGKGRGGRSFSFGIADAVTVLAKDAASADAAATVIANAVDLPTHPLIGRVAACSIDPDSDLGARLITAHVPILSSEDVATALHSGRLVADMLLQAGLMTGAILALQGEVVLCGDVQPKRLAA